MDTTRFSLIQRVRDLSDQDAWEEFTLLYQPLIQRYVRAWNFSDTEADDFAQESIAHLMKVMPKFEYDKTKGSFKKWMRVVVDNLILQHLRRKKEVDAHTDMFDRSQQRETDPEKHWDRVWMIEHLLYCLDKIRPRVEAVNFEAFRLNMLEEMPVEDICQKLKINKNRVYIAKTRISNMLKEEMKKLIGEESFN